MNVVQSLLHRPFFIRLLHWEYWSHLAVYIWIYPIWFLLSLRARSLFFFAAANPRITNGGFLNESKKDIVPMIPEALHPGTAFFELPANADIVLAELRRKNLQFPLIGKPNIGGRGRGVKVLADEAAVRAYVSRACLDFHIQEFVPYKQEAGIFYCRYPGEERGRVTGIVEKEFMTVTGDGKSTIRTLLQQNPRALMYLDSFSNMHGKRMDLILPEGELMVISPFGNHARGAKFIDTSYKADEEFTAMIDAICRQIPDFYYGRLDVRYRSWEEFKAGRHFSIIEVNGAGAEPTHIYDPKHSLFFAWKEIVRHWVMLNRISMANRKLGHRYLTWKEGVEMMRQDKLISARLAAMSD